MNKLTIILSVILVTACNQTTQKNGHNLNKTSLIQEWFPNANYAGELIAINDYDSINGLDIKLIAGSDQLDPIKMVLSDESQFGIASADRVIQANEKGADLVVIGVANYKTPTCFLSSKKINVNSIKDFEGKKIGVLTGTNTETIYRLLVKLNNLNKSKLNEIEAPFDLSTFISGKYDIRPAFVYDEPVSLENANFDYNILKPEDYNIKFLGTVYFCKRDFYENNKKIVEGFVNAIKAGWKKTFENPKYAIDLLKVYDKNIDTSRELKSLNKAIEYFKGENDSLLYASKETWDKMANDLIEIGYIKKFDYNKTVKYK